jgi:hypothetical protein
MSAKPPRLSTSLQFWETILPDQSQKLGAAVYGRLYVRRAVSIETYSR